MNSFHSPARAAFRLVAFLLWTLLVVPPYALILACGRTALPLVRRIARFYWRVTAAIVGFTITVRGTPSAERPTLFVANHASYLDIIVLGALLPAVFIAKKEVSQWPGIGLLAKLGRTTFVDRRPRKSLDQRDEMLGRIDKELESMILFPEGTSNDGNRVLPFKSALLSVAETPIGDGRSLAVQPVTVAYTRLDNLPIGRIWRPFYAWYGDMDLAPHLWEALGMGSTTIEVEFHPPVRLEEFGSRKALSDHCHDVVSNGLVAANAGRLPPITVSQR
ncbi:MAG TPA: lysophospholipid acyltransferase family protein [Candidatus Sulfotelmatobacter sp.]|nr:lysophospholipid acyltransferase family protein [Candidatus Sulfotelmatobacter sp.]